VLVIANLYINLRKYFLPGIIDEYGVAGTDFWVQPVADSKKTKLGPSSGKRQEITVVGWL
jgi:hypothetical protein